MFYWSNYHAPNGFDPIFFVEPLVYFAFLFSNETVITKTQGLVVAIAERKYISWLLLIKEWFGIISFLVLTLFHFIILGHTVDEVLFRTHVPKQFSAPNLPELNRSQVHAVRHALQRPLSLIQGKVEKILKCILDSIPSPSPSVKIQNMGGKIWLRCKGKILLGIVDKLLKTKILLTSPSNVSPFYLK